MRGHLILVGLPGSGKSTVGREVARVLRRPFLDFDTEIARREQCSVQELFERHGEANFRALERTLTESLRLSAPAVLAPGGGWLSTPGNLELLAPPAETVYLQLSPAEALARMGPAVADRPLLAGADPLAALERLFRDRERTYLQSNHTLSVGSLALDEVVRRIVALAEAGYRD